MFDPRTGGVTQTPRKTKKNGVNNLKERCHPLRLFHVHIQAFFGIKSFLLKADYFCIIYSSPEEVREE